MKHLHDALLREILLPRAVFTSRDVANLTGSSMAIVSRRLGALAERGILTRVTRGVWAQVRHPDFSPYAVLPFILQPPPCDQSEQPLGYVSLLSALSLHGLISQIPRAISVVAAKRLPTLRTPVATYEFHRMERALIGGFEPFGQLRNFDVARAEKALFDTLYFSVRKGRRFAHLPELDLPRTFRPSEVQEWISRVTYAPLRNAVARRWRAILERTGSRMHGRRYRGASRVPML
jgi:hypothetical protein